MTETEVRYITMFFMYCRNCGIKFGVPDSWDNARRNDGKSFCCPNGHWQSYHETDLDRLHKILQREQAARKQAEEHARHRTADCQHMERSRAATKGALTRTKNRIARGVCPCCNRTFRDLAQHMKHKHPEYAGSDVSQKV